MSSGSKSIHQKIRSLQFTRSEKIVFITTAILSFLFMASITRGSGAPLEILLRFIGGVIRIHF